jgi:hypothetical protein
MEGEGEISLPHIFTKKREYMRNLTLVEILVMTIIATVMLAMIGSILFQIYNPEQFCDIARRTMTLNDLPASCLDETMYPSQRIQIEYK